MFHLFRVTSWDKDLGPQPVVRAVVPGEIARMKAKPPPLDRAISVRGGRLITAPESKKKKKYKYNREFGKGIMGNFLNRTLNRQRITSLIEQQFEEVSNHRFEI